MAVKEKQFDIPVLLITFNRPDNAKKVFDVIKKIQPAKFYFFSDAPREGNHEDPILVDQTRQLLDGVNWPCVVSKKFERKNLGCGPGPHSAINWIFEHEERAIILEDDCLPHESFFAYCKHILNKYNDEPRIMHVSGTRWNEEFYIGNYDFFYSSIGHVWGWATWKRAWKLYDYTMRTWNAKTDWQALNTKLKNRIRTQYWVDNFDHTYRYNAVLKHAWDYQWQYTLFKNNGLAVVPNVNLICNIGVQGVHASTDHSDKSSFNRMVSHWRDRGKQFDSLAAVNDFDEYHIDHYFMRNVKPIRKVKLYLKSFLNQV